jgi:hypothetical protein
MTLSGLNGEGARTGELIGALPVREMALGAKQTTVTGRHIISFRSDSGGLSVRPMDCPLDDATTHNCCIIANETDNGHRFGLQVSDEIIDVVGEGVGGTSIK